MVAAGKRAVQRAKLMVEQEQNLLFWLLVWLGDTTAFPCPHYRQIKKPLLGSGEIVIEGTH